MRISDPDGGGDFIYDCKGGVACSDSKENTTAVRHTHMNTRNHGPCVWSAGMSGWHNTRPECTRCGGLEHLEY